MFSLRILLVLLCNEYYELKLNSIRNLRNPTYNINTDHIMRDADPKDKHFSLV